MLDICICLPLGNIVPGIVKRFDQTHSLSKALPEQSVGKPGHFTFKFTTE